MGDRENFPHVLNHLNYLCNWENREKTVGLKIKRYSEAITLIVKGNFLYFFFFFEVWGESMKYNFAERA